MTTHHRVAHVWNTPGGHRWFAECECGWRNPAPMLNRDDVVCLIEQHITTSADLSVRKLHTCNLMVTGMRELTSG